MIAVARATNQLSSLLLLAVVLCAVSVNVVLASPVRSSESAATASVAAPRNIDSLRKSIELLRQSMGVEMFQNFRYDFSGSENNSEDSSSHPAAILNIKADLRPMDTAKSEDPESDNVAPTSIASHDEERPQMDSPPSGQSVRHRQHHSHRHSAGSGARKHRPHHRLRRKGCPVSKGGQRQMICPSRNAHNYDVCISVEQLCDKVPDCPHGEDEEPTACLFYKTTREQLKQIYNTVLLLADHAVDQQQHFEL